MLLIQICAGALLALGLSQGSQRKAPSGLETKAASSPAEIGKPEPPTPPANRLAPPVLDSRARVARSLVEAELAFAQKARQEGNHAAFLSVLDDRGVLFRPGPVIGKAWLRKQQPDASKLTWFPSFVDVSEAGDLGYSTGPYEWRADAESKQVAHGHFVSIWGRRGGAWKLWVDMGSPHAAPAEEDPVFEPQNSKGAGMGQAAPPFSAEALQNLEKEFWNAVSARGTLPAYLAYLAADARFYRPGALPTTDLDAIRKALEKAKGATVWTCLGSAMAKSNDLGYVYGISERAMDLPQEPGATPIPVRKHFIFLHVWKRQPDGRWKVALDIENPLP